MKALIIKEEDVEVLLERIKLVNLTLRGTQHPADEIHRQIHHRIVS